MSININDFQKMSTRTCPFNAAPKADVQLWNVLANYSCGLVGEHFEYELELSKVSLIPGEEIPENVLDKVESEVGDTMHYAVNLLTILGHEFDESLLKEEVTILEVTEALKDILELHKKYVYHGHEFKKDEFINAVYVIISEFKNIYGDVLEYILEKNIEKLKKRYPESFNSEDSVKRVDVK